MLGFCEQTRLYDDGTPRTKHVITNVNIQLDGDSATASSYATVFQQTDVLPLQPIASGRYLDRFDARRRSWRFADRLITGFLLGDRSQHVVWHDGSAGGGGVVSLLPPEFADLEGFAPRWCLRTEPERWAERHASSIEEMRELYDAVFPRVEAIYAYLDRFPLDSSARGRQEPAVPRALVRDGVVPRGGVGRPPYPRRRRRDP